MCQDITWPPQVIAALFYAAPERGSVSRSSRCTVGFRDEIEPQLGSKCANRGGGAADMLNLWVTIFPDCEQGQPTGHPDLEGVELTNHGR